MKVLVACEESQAVTKELRALGVEAYSCDILDTSGEHLEWHLKQDVMPLLKEKWDMIIAFPPCTYLTVTGNRWFNVERYGEKALKRLDDRKAAIEFVKAIWNANSKHIAIENPVGILSTEFRKPSQIIEPYYFGDPFEKRTCLWLKNLPKLKKRLSLKYQKELDLKAVKPCQNGIVTLSQCLKKKGQNLEVKLFQAWHTLWLRNGLNFLGD